MLLHDIQAQRTVPTYVFGDSPLFSNCWCVVSLQIRRTSMDLWSCHRICCVRLVIPIHTRLWLKVRDNQVRLTTSSHLQEAMIAKRNGSKHIQNAIREVPIGSWEHYSPMEVRVLYISSNSGPLKDFPVVGIFIKLGQHMSSLWAVIHSWTVTVSKVYCTELFFL